MPARPGKLVRSLSRVSPRSFSAPKQGSGAKPFALLPDHSCSPSPTYATIYASPCAPRTEASTPPKQQHSKSNVGAQGESALLASTNRPYRQSSTSPPSPSLRPRDRHQHRPKTTSPSPRAPYPIPSARSDSARAAVGAGTRCSLPPRRPTHSQQILRQWTTPLPFAPRPLLPSAHPPGSRQLRSNPPKGSPGGRAKHARNIPCSSRRVPRHPRVRNTARDRGNGPS